MPVTDLPLRHPAGWARATRHPFLDAIRAGTLDRAAFDAWLVQDHLFVADLLRMQARLLARAPRPAQAVLAGGAAALVDELAWFERHAATRGLELGSAPAPATTGYARLLDRLDAAAPPVALAMLWALEQVYLDAWSSAAPGAPAYREFVTHWTTPEFRGYVVDLATAADTVLAAEAVPATELDGWFVEVTTAEAALWDMAWTGGPAA